MTTKRMSRTEFNAMMASNPLWKYIHLEIEEDDDTTLEQHQDDETQALRKQQI